MDSLFTPSSLGREVDSKCDRPDHRGMRISPLALLLVSCLVLPAFAQEAPPLEPETASHGLDVLGGLAGIVGLPVGEFGDRVDTAWGGSGYLLVTKHRGAFGLRLQGDLIGYDSQTLQVPISGSPQYTTAISTTYGIGTLSIGPQYLMRTGRVRPYAHVTAGCSFVNTDSEGDLERTTNFEDTTFAWGIGAGVLIPLRSSLALDLGVRYAANQRVDYLAEGDIAEGNRRGVLSFTPSHSEANLVEFNVGLSFGR